MPPEGAPPGNNEVVRYRVGVMETDVVEMAKAMQDLTVEFKIFRTEIQTFAKVFKWVLGIVAAIVAGLTVAMALHVLGF